MGLHGKKLGLWDYTLFEIGITEISFEIGIMDLEFNQIWIFHLQYIGIMGFHPIWKYYGITLVLKLGLQDPPYGGPFNDIIMTAWCLCFI